MWRATATAADLDKAAELAQQPAGPCNQAYFLHILETQGVAARQAMAALYQHAGMIRGALVRARRMPRAKLFGWPLPRADGG